MSTRLSNAVRIDIRNRMISEGGFGAKRAKVSAAVDKIEGDMYKKAMAPYQADLEAFPHQTFLRKNDRGITVRFVNKGGYEQVMMVGPKKDNYRPYQGDGWQEGSAAGEVLVPELPWEMYEEYEKLTQESARIREEEQKLNSQIHAVLAECNTLKQLWERWPEAAQFAPAPEAKELLPMVVIEGINRQLGISRPVEN